MASFEHPKGPEFGRLYPTPEEARESQDEPVISIGAEDYERHARKPEVQAMLKRACELVANREGITVEEFIARRQAS